MRASAQGRSLIEKFEGLRLSTYKDQRGIPTIGYGHTSGVKIGDTCTQQQADAWLANDLITAERGVNESVHVELSQNEFDALVSLCYNIGAGAFAHSTLVELLNKGKYSEAANQFLAWCKTDGNINQGLLNRRRAEMELFEAMP